MTKLKVGDQILAVYSRRSAEPKEVTVVKIGKKFLYIKEFEDQIEVRWPKFHKNTLIHDAGGYSASISLYADTAEYEEYLLKSHISTMLRRHVERLNFMGLSVAELRELARIMRLELAKCT